MTFSNDGRFSPFSISGVFAGTFLLLGSEVLSGVLDLSGSIAALGFGVAAMGGDQVYELRHRRNIMAPVWHGHEPGREFPAAVWRYLNSPLRESSSRTRRDNILGSWRARLGKPGSKLGRRRIELFFGDGGVYRIMSYAIAVKCWDCSRRTSTG